MTERNNERHSSFAAYPFDTFDGLPRDGCATNTVYPVKYMVAVGGLSEGFQFYGPFETPVRADRWARLNLKSSTFYRVHNMFDVRDGG